MYSNLWRKHVTPQNLTTSEQCPERSEPCCNKLFLWWVTELNGAKQITSRVPRHPISAQASKPKKSEDQPLDPWPRKFGLVSRTKINSFQTVSRLISENLNEDTWSVVRTMNKFYSFLFKVGVHLQPKQTSPLIHYIFPTWFIYKFQIYMIVQFDGDLMRRKEKRKRKSIGQQPAGIEPTTFGAWVMYSTTEVKTKSCFVPNWAHLP